jgi:hypothetical protein
MVSGEPAVFVFAPSHRALLAPPPAPAPSPCRPLLPPPPPRPPCSLRDTYPLVFLSTVGPSTLEFAQASLEWMSDGVTRAFDSGRGNPLRLK